MTTPAMQAIFQRAWDAVGGDPKIIGCARDEGPEKIDVLQSVGRPSPGMTSYATIGMYLGETGNVSDGKPLRVELLGLCADGVEDFDNMLASCAFNVLSGDYGIRPGTIFPDVVGQYLSGVTMKHMLLVPVFSWDAPDNLETDDVVVTWLQAVPVSAGEMSHARAEGADALLDLLEEQDVDIADLDRPSAA